MSRHDGFVRNALGAGALVLALAAFVACTGLATCWFGGGAFVRFGIRTDLDDYRSWTEASDLPPADRAEVVARLDRIHERVGSGDVVVPFVVWVTIDEVIEGILVDGHVPPDELAALHDQLTRIEGWR